MLHALMRPDDYSQHGTAAARAALRDRSAQGRLGLVIGSLVVLLGLLVVISPGAAAM